MSVFAEKHYPDTVYGTDLDHYLAQGWYRMGQSIFTTHFLCFGHQMYSAIWVRLDLEKFHFRKGQRKLMRRNGTLFQVSIGDLNITPEKELLYQRYKQSFKGYIAKTITDSLLDGDSLNIYDTLEISIRNEAGELVGLSYFDVGRHSAASILGIYDPRYQEYSLGYYTMLLEMKYCMAQSIRYYYPGYVVPGYNRFDYKLRIGPVDYLQLSTKQWVPFEQLESAEIPINTIDYKLGALQQALSNLGITSQRFCYPLFEANLFGLFQAHYLDHPVVLALDYGEATSSRRLLAVYDVSSQAFQLLSCTDFDDYRFYYNEAYIASFDQSEHLLQLTIVENICLAHTDVEAMAQEILEFLGNIA